MSNTLVVQNNNTGVDVKTLPSYEVAKMMDRTHAKVLRMLEGGSGVVGIIPTLNEAKTGLVDFFIESTYVDKKR